MPLPQYRTACYHFLPCSSKLGMCHYQDVSMAKFIGKQYSNRGLSGKTHTWIKMTSFAIWTVCFDSIIKHGLCSILKWWNSTVLHTIWFLRADVRWNPSMIVRLHGVQQCFHPTIQRQREASRKWGEAKTDFLFSPFQNSWSHYWITSCVWSYCCCRG